MQRKCLLAAFIAVTAVVAAPAAILHVGSGQTYSTIQAAYEAASTGDHILIHEGWYNGPDLSNYDADKDNLAFESYGSDKVVITSRIYVRYKEALTFDGLIFWRSSDGRGLHFRVHGADINNHVVKNCIFFENPYQALYAYAAIDDPGQIENVTVENCTFYANNGHGIQTERRCNNWTIKDCIFVSNADTAVHASYDNVAVQYTAFFDNTDGPVSGNATTGTGCLTGTEPVFASTDINDPDFMHLAPSCPDSIKTGASNGGYMGARPVYTGPVYTANTPYPGDSAEYVAADAVLTWTAGYAAGSHDVYLGTDMSAVLNAGRPGLDLDLNGQIGWTDLGILSGQWLQQGCDLAADLYSDCMVDGLDLALLGGQWMVPQKPFRGNQVSSAYNPGGLKKGQTYYWRIDEVNESHPDSPWAGDLWRFTTVPEGLFVDVTADLVGMGIYYRNAAGDGSTDDSAAFQAAIDHVAQAGGGTVYAPGGRVYMVGGLEVYDDVKLLGDGIDDTVFRAATAGKLVTLTGTGPELEGFTAYGTEDEAHSGDNWYADYPDSGGPAKASHVIQVLDAVNARIEKVRSLEGRYDSLYIRTVSGLSVIDCTFQRANRNIVSIVGDTEKFIFIDCYFGTLYGLYHFDIEANTDKYTREGVILNCQFDGSIAGTWPGTNGNWGYWLLLKGYDTPGERRDLNVLGCDFDKIGIRINKIFPNCQFTCNTIDPNGTVFFRSTSNNPVGDLKDSVIRGNEFVGVNTWYDVKDGATFSGSSFFACNEPSWANDTSCSWPVCGGADAAFLTAADKEDICELSYEDLDRMAENCPRKLIQAVRR